jgi:hypothetical protein
MRSFSSDPLEYSLMDGCMGVIQENMIRNPTPYLGADLEVPAPAAGPATPKPADVPWYARPVDWLLDMVGNVNYIDDDIAVRVNDGTLIVDRSGVTATPPPQQPPTIINVPSALQNIPTVAWIAGGLVLFVVLTKK